jgi:hypothetical protein
MKNNNNSNLKNFLKSEVPFTSLINNILKEKILFLFIFFIFLLLAYLFTKTRVSDYKINITINPAPQYIFDPYRELVSKDNALNRELVSNDNALNRELVSNDNALNFNLMFSKNLLSTSNLSEYFEKNSNQDFIKYLFNEKKIDFRKYYLNDFSKKIGQVKENNQTINNKYFLIYPENIDGRTFFINYVKFTKDKTTNEFANQLKFKILYAKTSYLQALEYAEQLQIDQSTQKLDQITLYNSLRIYNEHIPLFLYGKQILNYKIKEIEKINLYLEKEKFNYNPILDLSLIPSKISNHNLFLLIGFIIAFFLSSLIIFFKNMLK